MMGLGSREPIYFFLLQISHWRPSVRMHITAAVSCVNGARDAFVVQYCCELQPG
jgi:hypothetical protein